MQMSRHLLYELSLSSYFTMTFQMLFFPHFVIYMTEFNYHVELIHPL